jgi:hypothetical protein
VSALLPNNVLHVDFRREPDPPAPKFPGAGASRTGAQMPAEAEEQFWQLHRASRLLAA